MVEIKSIVFDLEGTIVNLEWAHHKGHILAAKDIGLNLSLKECFEKIPHFVGGPDEIVAKEIVDLASNEGIVADYKDILKKSTDYFDDMVNGCEIKLREGFVDFIKVIKKLDIKCAIGSLTSRSKARIILEKTGLSSLIEEKNIVFREDVKNLKPSPDVWIETAKRAGVNPSEQLVFEDSPRGIQGAVEIGAYCIGMPIYNDIGIIKALLEAGAKRIFLNWDEISAEDLIDNIKMEGEDNDSL